MATKENLTSINVIIDQSGSMAGLTSDTIGGFNKFLSDQKDVPGEALFTLCTFNTDYRLVYDCVKLADVPALDDKIYRPGGGTALLDAMGATIETVGQKLNSMPEEDRPSKVLFLIMTDGEENSSRRFSAAQIKEMVSHQTEKYNWNFIFMGANIDAFTAGDSLGVATQNTLGYSATSAGTARLYSAISDSTTRYRGSAVNTANSSDGFFGNNSGNNP